MDGDRVCEIYLGATRCGSGYLISDTLVLTASHVARDTGNAVLVRRWHGSGLAAGVVLWSRWVDDMDAALIRITGPAWSAPKDVPPVRWGRLVTNGASGESVGFPDVQVVTDSAGAVVLRDLEHPACWISPVTNGKIGMLGVSVTTSLPVPTPDEEPSPWAGMSGAPVFCGPVLVGVVATHPDGFDTSRLVAVPASRVLADEDVAALLVAEFGARPVVESAELVALAVDAWPANSPAALLRADVEAVAFRGRDELLAQLRDWCVRPGRHSVRLLSGPGGQGKTRLARELGHRMRAAGWAVLHVASELPVDPEFTEHVVPASAPRAADRYDVLLRLAVPLLVVIDYAETRVLQVGAVLRALYSTSKPVRLLLVARTGGAWVDELVSAQSAVDAVVGESLVEIMLSEQPAQTTVPVPVPALAETLTARQTMFDDAVAAYAARLPAVPGHGAVDWAAAATAVRRPDLSPSRYDTALGVQMAALAALLDQQDPDNALVAPEDVLLRHERRYWLALAPRHGVQNLARFADRLVAVAAVCAADSEQEALATVDALPIMAGQPAALRPAVAQWLRELYPAQHGYWGGLQPDRLAEYFVAAVLAEQPDLLDPVLSAGTQTQRYRGLIVLSRAAVDRPATRATLNRLITTHPIALAATALGISTAVENPQPLIAAVDELIDGPDADPQLLAALFDAIPWNSQLHRGRSTRIAALLVDHYRRWDTELRAAAPRRHRWRRGRPTDATSGLATTLLALAGCRFGLGELADALAASDEGLSLLDKVARADADYPLELAKALSTRCVVLDALGRTADALSTVDRMTALYAGMTEQEPDEFRPQLGVCEYTRGTLLMKLGRVDEALECLRRSVDMLDANADVAFAASAAAEADSNLGAALSLMGHKAQAVAAARRGVDRFRRLVDDRPDEFEPLLAPALINLSKTLFEADDTAAAHAVAEEAVDRSRRLAAAYPDVYRQALLLALSNAAAMRSARNMPEQALAAAVEAVDGLRALRTARPGVVEHEFMLALVNLGAILSDAQRWTAALAAGAEAVAVGRVHVRGNPTTFGPSLARALTNMAVLLSDDGRTSDALAAVDDAIDVLGPLAEHNPTAHSHQLVAALAVRGTIIAESGRSEAARAAAVDLVALCRRKAPDDPQLWEPLLADALAELGRLLTELDRHTDALAVDLEALDITRRLASRAPDRFAERLVDVTEACAIDLTALDRPKRALALWRDTEAQLRAWPGAARELGTALLNVGRWSAETEHHAAALSATREAVAIRRAVDTPARLAAALNRLAARSETLGQLDETITARTEEAAIRHVLADDDFAGHGPGFADAQLKLGSHQLALGRFEDLLVSAQVAVEAHRRLIGELGRSDEADLGSALYLLGLAHVTLGAAEPARQSLAEAAELLRPLVGRDGVPLVLAGVLLAIAEVDGTQDVPGRLAALAEAMALYRPAYREDPDGVGMALGSVLAAYGRTLLESGRPEPAWAALDEAVQVLVAHPTAQHGTVFDNVGASHLDMARTDLALVTELLADADRHHDPTA